MIKGFAEKLSNKWHKPYSEVMGWVRARLSFAHLVCDRPMCPGFENEMEEWFWHGGWSRPVYDHTYEQNLNPQLIV